MQIALTVQTSHLVGSEMQALLRDVRLGAAVRFNRFRAKNDAQIVLLPAVPTNTDARAIRAAADCLLTVPSAFGFSALSRLLPRSQLISASVENPGDQKFSLFTVVDHMILDREGTHVRTELGTTPSYPRKVDKHVQPVEDGVEQSIGSFWTCIVSNV